MSFRPQDREWQRPLSRGREPSLGSRALLQAYARPRVGEVDAAGESAVVRPQHGSTTSNPWCSLSSGCPTLGPQRGSHALATLPDFPTGMPPVVPPTVPAVM